MIFYKKETEKNELVARPVVQLRKVPHFILVQAGGKLLDSVSLENYYLVQDFEERLRNDL